MKTFLDMLRYMRPEGSKTKSAFCDKFLAPIFGNPDLFGNYILRIGDSPVMFTSHSDTVHKIGGFQTLEIVGDIVRLSPKSQSNCLGADCTSGIWLMLQMIKAGVSGFYVIFAGEELGCIGSGKFAKLSGHLIEGIQACISFDRKGTESIITHQMGLRTSSDEFAYSLAEILNLDLSPDSGGMYTDSNEFAHLIPECTNLSVGYYGQHSANETQDLTFLSKLATRLIGADWDGLRFARDCTKPESRFDDWRYYGASSNERDLESLCVAFPEAMAAFLESQGFRASDLIDDMKLSERDLLELDWIWR